MEKTEGKILIVDDNSLNAELLAETLAPLNYEMVVYSNPVKALEDLKNTKIDLVLTDVVMPAMDGFFFAEQFLKQHPNTPVIYISSHSENENKIKSYNLGSYTYIEKPFDVKTTRAQVQSVLNLKKVQDELLKKNQKLDIIFEFSKSEIIITDLNFDITSQNNVILDKAKYNGKNFFEILAMHKNDEAITLLKNFIKSKKSHTSFRFIIDNDIYTKTDISKIYSNECHTGYLILIENKTEEIKREEQRENFIEMLTHDLKTPVRAEKRALELLYDGSFGELNSNQKDIIKEILNSSRYMMRMTDNILARYKLESENYALHLTTNSLKQTLQNCIDEVLYLFEEGQQTLKVNIDLDNDVFEYDEKEISLVLTNLIVNASEYSPKNALINVNIKKEGQNIVISIKDNGPGISKKEQVNIFKEHSSKETRFKKVGSGFGLFIVKNIIEAHNGSVWIESEENKGCEIILSLPCTKNASVPVKNN